jgi:hypothetical protein
MVMLLSQCQAFAALSTLSSVRVDESVLNCCVRLMAIFLMMWRRQTQITFWNDKQKGESDSTPPSALL